MTPTNRGPFAGPMMTPTNRGPSTPNRKRQLRYPEVVRTIRWCCGVSLLGGYIFDGNPPTPDLPLVSSSSSLSSIPSLAGPDCCLGAFVSFVIPSANAYPKSLRPTTLLDVTWYPYRQAAVA